MAPVGGKDHMTFCRGVIINVLFSADACREYLQNRLPIMRNIEYARRLASLNESTPMDIEKETINILCRHRVQFTEQLRICNTAGRKFDIDFNNICRDVGI